jgi:hypothetical protein
MTAEEAEAWAQAVRFIFSTAPSLSKTVHLIATVRAAATALMVMMLVAVALGVMEAAAPFAKRASFSLRRQAGAGDQQGVAPAAREVVAEGLYSRVRAKAAAIYAAEPEATMDRMARVLVVAVVAETNTLVARAEPSTVMGVVVTELTAAVAAAGRAVVATVDLVAEAALGSPTAEAMADSAAAAALAPRWAAAVSSVVTVAAAAMAAAERASAAQFLATVEQSRFITAHFMAILPAKAWRALSLMAVEIQLVMEMALAEQFFRATVH